MLPILALVTFVAFNPAQEALELEPIASSQYRWYDGVALPLQLDARHVFVLDATGDARDALAGRGVTSVSLWMPDSPEWLFAEVPAGSRDERSIAELARRIAAGDDGQFVSPVFVDNLGGPMFLQREVYVAFEHSLTSFEAEALVAASGAFEVLERDTAGMRDVWLLRSLSLDGFAELAATNALAETRGVRFAEPNWTSSARLEHVPNDPRYPDAWALNNTGQTTTAPNGGGTAGIDMNAPEAWDFTKGAGVIVMVMDDGAQLNHPDLNVGWGQDWTNLGGSGGPVSVWDNHGTAVSSCIAARMNSIDTVGLAPEAVIATAKIFEHSDASSGTITAQWVIDALWAAQQIGVRVTNSSWSKGVQSAAMDQKFTDTRNAGMVHFAASGNGGIGTVAYPAVIGPVHAVGAIDWDGNRADFADGCSNAGGGSNWGQELSWVAPGEDILTADRTGADGYVNGSVNCGDGTSYACPYAAAVAALILSRDPTLDAAGVETIMRDNSRDLGAPGYDTTFGWGCVDALKALQKTKGPPIAYCTGGTTSNGCIATMSSVGSPSASQTSGFTLVSSNVEGQKAGLIFYGANGRHSFPWGAGSTSTLCVKSPVQRSNPLNSGGNTGVCNGSLALDWLAYLNAHPGAIGSPLVPGATFNAQTWFRDPAAPGTTNLSNAIEFVIVP